MFSGIHFLLTYACTFRCDHCFLHCSPEAKGTFTLAKLKKVFNEINKVETIKSVYFEGGEPFLYYPLMAEGLRLASQMGLKIGIVTNAYFAICPEDAELWLGPLADIGINDLSLSDDAYHQEDDENNTAKFALKAAKNLNIPVGTICIEAPKVERSKDADGVKGEPIIGGNVRFRGRAAEKLIEGLPRRSIDHFTECPDEDLEKPGRVHLDCYGNVQTCQGLCLGNMWDTPLSQLMKEYDVNKHPVCGPLHKGGPLELCRAYDVPHEQSYVDACHFCYEIRKTLIDRFPQYLAPRQVYGLE